MKRHPASFGARLEALLSRWTGLALALLLGQPCAAAVWTVTSVSDSGPGSLREAIVNANAGSGDTIAFSLGGSGPHTISVASPLPDIVTPMVIDGFSQPGYAGKPLIELSGGASVEVGLRILAGGCQVQGLAINHFVRQGIHIEGNGANVIRGNFIGTDPQGALARPNGQQGVLIYQSAGNVVGGTNTADRNVISANLDAGVYIVEANDNRVLGNFIGTTATGDSALGNAMPGIALYNSSANTIGGSEPGARNVISGNLSSGVYIFGPLSSANAIQGNFIGTDAAGAAPLNNLGDGITLSQSTASVIGGTSAGARNVISGNALAGVSLIGAGTSGNRVEGNFIGTAASGTAAVGNGLAGVTLFEAGNNVVGGAAAGARNVISGNGQDGMFLTTNSIANRIDGNYIGVAATGSAALSNGFSGITLQSAHSNLIGTQARNVISGNGVNGIDINAGATGNVVERCYVGADSAGRIAVPNRSFGIRIESPANTVRSNLVSGNGLEGVYLFGAAAVSNSILGNFIGTASNGVSVLRNGRGGVGIVDAPRNIIGGAGQGDGNLISAHSYPGIFVNNAGSSGNRILGNKIGTDVTGNQRLGNFEGISLAGAKDTVIGGSLPGSGNLISANNNRGIWLQGSSGTVIQGNLIGTKADGSGALGNASYGVECGLGSSNNLIGGGWAGNVIAYSQGGFAGVRVRSGVPNSLNNRVLGNRVFGNTGLGIDLGIAGVTPNDDCDLDAGGNRLQNYPVLAGAVSSADSISISGALNSAPDSVFQLQFFANPGCGSGQGQGEVLLGDALVATGADCMAGFVATFPAVVPPGDSITATATDADGNTSEFSACVAAGSAPALAFAPAADQQLSLAWTNFPDGFILKQAGSLSPPVVWSPVTNVPLAANGQFVVTLPGTNGSRYYRLSFE